MSVDPGPPRQDEISSRPLTPFDVAVVIPTIQRRTLSQAVQSVFSQRFDGRIQILIGIDQTAGTDRSAIENLMTTCPDTCAVTVIDPGYSTARQRGGHHAAQDCGALRTILSYLAHSRYIAYLDDDNWWHDRHLANLRRAIDGNDWAFSFRWYVDPVSDRPVCIDKWESVGPNRGVYAKALGGFVDPNCLMVDKTACEPVLRLWSLTGAKDGVPLPPDRLVFDALCAKYRAGESREATCFYRLNPKNHAHAHRLKWIESAT